MDKATNVEMMVQENEFKMARFPDLNARTLELPYKAGERISMHLLLPDNNIKETEAKLCSINF